MWDSNPNRGIARETHKKRPFSRKALSAPLARSQNKGLHKYPRRASQLPYRALPPWRQRGRRETARARRQGAAAISAPEMTSSTKLWAGSQLLTSSSWDPRWLTSARSVTAWDQLPRGDIRHTWNCALVETEWRGPGRWVRRMAQRAPGRLSCSDLGGPQNAQPIQVCALVEHLRTLSGSDLGSAWNAGPTWHSALAEHPGDWSV